jgi:nitroreductase
MIYESIIKRRTIRKFTLQRVPSEILNKCVDAARLSPSGMNRQPLKYIIVNDPQYLLSVFSTLTWARNIPGYKHAPDEVPMAYIIILLDTKIKQQAGNDPGIAAMSISMVAHEGGLSSCILGSVDRPRLQENLMIPDHLKILLVVALGYPREKSKAVELKDDNTKYYFDARGVLNVPKRKLKDILVSYTFQT